MRNKIFIIMSFAFFTVFFSMQERTTWYVSPTGSDSNAGTVTSPWRTLYKACTDPDVAEGDLIFALAGTHYIVVTCPLPDGVSIDGDGIDRTIFISTVSNGPAIKAESYGYWGNSSYGNQSISNITLDGDLTGQSAISVNFRSNVKIHHVKVIDFYQSGVTFYGQPPSAWTGTNPYETWKRMPNAWCTGNEVTNCIFDNNALYSGHGYGNLQYGQQNGFILRNTTITQTRRAAGMNGYGLKFFEEGWNRSSKISYNTITIAPRESGKYNFSIENWNDCGGCEYSYNTLQGQIDFSSTFDLFGEGYGSWFHHNLVGFSSLPGNTEVGVTPEAGWVDKCIINNNIFRNLTNAIILQHIYPIAGEHPNTGIINNVKVYNNLIYGIGELSSSTRWSYGSVGGIAIEDYQYNTGNITDSVFVDNNTVVSAGVLRSNTYMSCGILLAGNQTLTNIRFRNNIVKGFNGSTSLNAPFIAFGTMPNTNLLLQNNDFNGNGNSNAPLWDDLHGGQFATGTGYSYTGNITTDPLFTSSTDFRLLPTSGAIGTGIYVGITTDFLNIANNNPPEMGCYAYTSGIVIPTVTTITITEITTTSATSGGIVTNTGGSAVTARGVCWSLTANPTLADSHTSDGTGAGSYASSITGLTAGQTYHVRAYATNSAGTSYGSDRSFVTEEGGQEQVNETVYKYNNTLIIYQGKPIRP